MGEERRFLIGADVPESLQVDRRLRLGVNCRVRGGAVEDETARDDMGMTLGCDRGQHGYSRLGEQSPDRVLIHSPNEADYGRLGRVDFDARPAGALEAFLDRGSPALAARLVADVLVDDFLALPTTVTTPGPGTKLVSSPVAQRTLSKEPPTPVTTPSRAGWPDLLGRTLTLSPTDAIGRLLSRSLLEATLSPAKVCLSHRQLLDTGRMRMR
jgi:hypothetical protein